jgi:rSAM/selenodomain-associated transferase 2
MNPPGNNILRLSVIVPTLNEEGSIGATLSALARDPAVAEVIVADGGSWDRTPDIALEAQAILVAAQRGRGAQLAAGAEAATGGVLWFLHGDTIPGADAGAAILASMREATVVGGNCTIRFDGDRRSARFLSWLYPHLRKLGLLYGDSGIFVRRETYERCGGFRPHPIFEDLDLVRRLRKEGRLVHIAEMVTTSSRRFEGKSFTLTFASWTFLQLLYWFGVSPERLGRIYYRQREGMGASPRIEPIKRREP